MATLEVSDTLDLADDVMRLGRVRHFPVTRAGMVVGVLSERDVYRAAASSVLDLQYGASHAWLSRVPVDRAMSRVVHTIEPDRPLRDAVDIMLRERIGCLPVLESGSLVGLVSETDCLRHLSALLAGGDAEHPPRDLPL